MAEPQVTALTVSTKDGKVHSWNLADYPSLMLGHAFCVAKLSDLSPDEVTGSGWKYSDGTEVMYPWRWNPDSVRRINA